MMNAVREAHAMAALAQIVVEKACLQFRPRLQQRRPVYSLGLDYSLW